MVTNLQLFHLFRVLQWRRTLQLTDRGIAARSKYKAIQIYYCAPVAIETVKYGDLVTLLLYSGQVLAACAARFSFLIQPIRFLIWGDRNSNDNDPNQQFDWLKEEK